MKVKDVVYAAAQTLGILDGVKGYFESGDEGCKREAELLLSCFNGVESGLALEYLPLYAEDEVLAPTKRVEYASLTYSPVRILKVTDELGEATQYTLYPQYLIAKAGRLKITYTYTPNRKEIEEQSDFALYLSETLLVYGTLAEYCAAEGCFDEASVWDKKYKAGIEKVVTLRSCKRINSRRWV